MTLCLTNIFTEKQLKMFDHFISEYQRKQQEKHSYIYENDSIYGITDTHILQHGEDFEKERGKNTV